MFFSGLAVRETAISSWKDRENREVFIILAPPCFALLRLCFALLRLALPCLAFFLGSSRSVQRARLGALVDDMSPDEGIRPQTNKKHISQPSSLQQYSGEKNPTRAKEHQTLHLITNTTTTMTTTATTTTTAHASIQLQTCTYSYRKLACTIYCRTCFLG